MSLLMKCDLCGKIEGRDSVKDKEVVFEMDINGPVTKILLGKHYNVCEKCVSDFEEWRTKRLAEEGNNV